MKLKTTLVASLLMAGGISVAHATTYSVEAVFGDGGVQQQTLFNGTFDWDGSSVTNFTGKLSESMWEWNEAEGMFSREMTMMGNTFTQLETVYGPEGKNYDPGPYSQGEPPLLSLNYTVDNSKSVAAGLHAVSTFLMSDGNGAADTNVYTGGGYDGSITSTYYGKNAPEVRNWNAFFTLVFDENNPVGTYAFDFNNMPEQLLGMEYGDCNQLGMMGDACMTGLWNGGQGGSMGGMPGALTIAEVAAVPVPAAAWLFGGALVSLFGANRRKSVLPA